MYLAAKSSPANIAAHNRSAPALPTRFRQIIAARLNEYKAGLLEEFSSESKVFLHFVRLAVNEAESLAWSTSFAHLFLPALAEEKIQYARQWTNRQCRIGSDSPPFPSQPTMKRFGETTRGISQPRTDHVHGNSSGWELD
jgi:hypothetical protein